MNTSLLLQIIKTPKQFKMKPILLLLTFVTLFIQIAVGQNAFREVSNKYKNQDQYFNTELSKHTIKLYLKEKQPNEEIKTVLQNIDRLKVLSFSIDNQGIVESFLNTINNHFELEKYIPFKVKTNGFDQQKIFLKEKKDKITNLLVINTSLEQVSLVEIRGYIDLEKIVLLNNALKIDGLETINGLTEEGQKSEKNVIGYAIPSSPQNIEVPKLNGQRAQVNGFKPWLIGSDNNLKIADNSGYRLYNKYGTKIMDNPTSPFVLVNGYKTKTDFQSSLSEINPECIQSINVEKKYKDFYPNGLINITLKGDVTDLFMICEGILFFGQDGYLQSIKIDDECGPTLLHNCKKKPLSKIIEMKPDEIKSIELTTDPRNCEGTLEGEFVVIESK